MLRMRTPQGNELTLNIAKSSGKAEAGWPARSIAQQKDRDTADHYMRWQAKIFVDSIYIWSSSEWNAIYLTNRNHKHYTKWVFFSVWTSAELWSIQFSDSITAQNKYLNYKSRRKKKREKKKKSWMTLEVPPLQAKSKPPSSFPLIEMFFSSQLLWEGPAQTGESD